MAFDNSKGREKVRKQVEDDLQKDYKWLLEDVFEELLYNELYQEEIQNHVPGVTERTPELAILHAAKRLASLQVQLALGEEKLQARIESALGRAEKIASNTLLATWIAGGIAVIALIVALCK